MFSALRQVSRPATSFRSIGRVSVGRSQLSPFVRTLVTKRFTTDHETIVFDDSTGLGTVHITEYAQSSLGDVVFVELPVKGSKIAQGDQIGAVESVKAASDIVECFQLSVLPSSEWFSMRIQYAPISGTIEEINEELNGHPGLLNKSPEVDGWLCKVKVSDPTELEALMTEEAYKEHCESH
ncbi:hypothetical protein JAAARDRAFT_189224 [Jaapia argillacea MUCL 33604]|uniref:Glycine cleavage system H protein n=1 Tax=Jaapia argillacea MUCL 33604 TaxID=933084 RepID=A0A067QM09_9AGAM|nr:hypothetical protein JAAARDRAFT_189224 [Jaapia argillacea MUCL 33604]